MTVPATYVKGVETTRLGIAREPTVGDFYNIWLQLNQQQLYPVLRPTDVNIVIALDQKVRDIINLKGYSEDPNLRNLPAQQYSSIYFESLDEKCLGKIEIRIDKEKGRQVLLSIGEFLLSGLPFAYSASHGGVQRYLGILASVSLLVDGIRRHYNAYKDGLIITIGSPYDDSEFSHILTRQKFQKFIERIKRLVQLTEFKEIHSSSSVEEFVDRMALDKTEELPTYTPEDLKRFQQFVEHIKGIKIEK